jgi:hypothetical protein
MRAAPFISFWRERKANFKKIKENRKIHTEKKNHRNKDEFHE